MVAIYPGQQQIQKYHSIKTKDEPSPNEINETELNDLDEESPIIRKSNI